MNKYYLAAFFSLLFFYSVAEAGNLTIDLNDDSIQASLNQLISEDDRGRSVFSLSGLYNDREESRVFTAALEVMGPLGNGGFELGAGVKGYYVKISKLDIAAGSLGVLASFIPPSISELKFSGNIYYCPKVFTFLDGDRMLSTKISVSYEITSRAAMYLSYTDTRADMENNQEWRIDNEFRGGLSLDF